MLEYFGYYTPEPETTELEQAQREAVMARAARLAGRPRHSTCMLPVARAWERTSSHEGPTQD